jgi:hypothetical protein
MRLLLDGLIINRPKAVAEISGEKAVGRFFGGLVLAGFHLLRDDFLDIGVEGDVHVDSFSPAPKRQSGLMSWRVWVFRLGGRSQLKKREMPCHLNAKWRNALLANARHFSCGG